MQLKEDSRTDPRWAWLRQGSRLLNRGWTIFDLAQIVDGRMDGPRWGVDRGGKRGTRPRRTRSEDSTAEAHAGAALKGSEFSGFAYRYLGCMYLFAGTWGTRGSNRDVETRYPSLGFFMQLREDAERRLSRGRTNCSRRRKKK